MLPFYFLSVATTLIMGLILTFLDKPKNDDSGEDFEGKYPILKDPTFLILLTIFSGFTAVSKMLSPVDSRIIIAGDLIPVIAGLSGSIVFLLRFLDTKTEQPNLPEFLTAFKNYEEIIGYLCLASAVLHLLFSKTLFL